MRLQILGLVLAFWIFLAVMVGWALGLAAALDAELYVVAAPLIAVPIIALSAFLWRVFSETW